MTINVKISTVVLSVCVLSQFSAIAKGVANPKLKDIPPNTVVDLGPFTWERPEGEPAKGTPIDYSCMIYDQYRHRILLFGGGHASTWTDAIYAFDFQTLSFKALYTPTPYKFYHTNNIDRTFWKSGVEGGVYPRPIGRHTYDLLCMPNKDEFFMLRTGTGPSAASHGIGYLDGAGGVYNFETKKWTIIPKKDINFGGYGDVAEYDPISKKIIGFRGWYSVHAFDPVTRKSEKIHDKTSGASGYEGSLVYCPLDTKMYLFNSRNSKVWSLTLNRDDLKKSTFQDLGDEWVDDNIKKDITPSFIYDAKRKVFAGGIRNGIFYTFSPVTKKWNGIKMNGVKGKFPLSMGTNIFIYDPIDDVYIFIGRDINRKWHHRIYAYKF